MTDPHTTLVRALQSAGLLEDPAWREAFTTIPPHHFLPCFYGASGDTWRRFDSQSVDDADRCRLAYRDQTWVVRLSGPHSQPGQPASSSVQPSLAARIIHELAVTENDHILEIGIVTRVLPCGRTPLPHQHIRRSSAPHTTRLFSRVRYPFAFSRSRHVLTGRVAR